MKFISVLIIISLFITSCGGGGNNKSSNEMEKNLDGSWNLPCVFYNETGFSEKNVINISNTSFLRNISMYKTSDCSGNVENKVSLKGNIFYEAILKRRKFNNGNTFQLNRFILLFHC